jgi:hypothetical protein
MTVHATGIAQIRHAETGTVYTILPDELVWYEVDSAERDMGPEVTHEAEIDHDELGQLLWRVWEYPLGMENDRETDIGPHRLVQNFNISLTSDIEPEDRAARIQVLVDWFHEHYEDPAQRTPYESAEGGYIWIWGGPYDARGVLEGEFNEVPEDILEAAVDEIESDGLFEWAPKEQSGDYDDADDEPDFDPADDLGDLGDAVERPADLKPGPVFGVDGTGHIGLLAWTPTDSLPDPALLEALREVATTLIEQLAGTNAHQDLLASAQRYSAALERLPLSIAHLYAEGVFLDNAVARLDRDVAADEVPALSSDVRQALDSVLDLHATYIMASTEGRELFEGATRYRRTPDAQAALDRSVAQVAALVGEAREIFTPEVRTYVAQAASQAGKGPNPARSNQLVRMIVGGAVFAATAVVATLIGDGFAGSPAGVSTMGAVTALSTAVGNFVAAHGAELQLFANLFAQEMGGLATAMERLLRHPPRVESAAKT